MKISLNGKAEDLDNRTTISELMVRLGYEQKRVAIAVNGNFIPRSQHATHELNDNDKVDIVAPMQGG